MLPAPIPMFSTPTDPDAFHDVRAPGGYEWWYFDADDPATDTQLVAIFLHGFIFHPAYVRAIRRYTRRPSKTPPPLPAHFPCAYFCVYRGGKILHQFMTQLRPDQFSASRESPDVTLGDCTLKTTADGGYALELRGRPWRLTMRGPQTEAEPNLSAALTFTPKFSHPPQQRVFLSRAMTGADHHWVLARPLCEVSGTIGRVGHEPTTFRGRGYHDHNYGTGPIGPGLKRWVWGRVATDDRVVTFHHAEANDASLARESHVIVADSSSTREIDASGLHCDWSGMTGWGLSYPLTIRCGEVLNLSGPRVIDSAPFYLRVLYRDTRGGTALCEVAHPHRLGWPVLGRMVEMSIDKSALRGTGT